MYVIQDTQIVLKEKYGSGAASRRRFYVKPVDQEHIVVTDQKKTSDVYDWLKHIFLPQGYPDSVSADYLSYQIWDTAQAFCSSISGTLATQEVLRGVGVGDNAVTPLSATITWVLKDGCGHLGRIIFAYCYGSSLDAYSKKWRLYADVLNDAALCCEIALPMFRNYTTFVLCISTIMKAVVGVAGGATRAAMTQHHALRGNMADVSAKDSAQETAVNLIASITALILISFVGNSMLLFSLMIILHIIFNYLAVRAVCLRSLNEPRFLQVIDTYLRHELISGPCEVNKYEPVVLYQLGSNYLELKLCGFHIKLGSSVKHVVRRTLARHVTKLKEIYASRKYILYPDVANRQMYVLLKDPVKSDDVLCAYFHAVLLSVIICAINDVDLDIYRATAEEPRPFAKLCHVIQTGEGWSRMPVHNEGMSGFKYDPSYELMSFVDQFVPKEWNRISSRLTTIGWDLKKHLLIMEEWRIFSHITEDPTLRQSEDYIQADTFAKWTDVDIPCGNIPHYLFDAPNPYSKQLLFDDFDKVITINPSEEYPSTTSLTDLSIPQKSDLFRGSRSKVRLVDRKQEESNSELKKSETAKKTDLELK